MKFIATLALLIVVLIGALIWQMTALRQNYFNERCFANITYTDATDNTGMMFHGNILFEFFKDKTGQFNLSGPISLNGNRFMFSRYVKFEYKHINNNNYRLKTHTIEALSHDNVPQDVADLAIKMLALSGERTLYIQKNSNDVITIGNPLAPMLNCVIQS